MIKQSLVHIIAYALMENIEIHVHVHKQKLLKTFLWTAKYIFLT